MAGVTALQHEPIIAALEAEVRQKAESIYELRVRVADLEAELDAARQTIAEQAAELAARPNAPTPLDMGAAVYRDALADFGAAVLAGRVAVAFREVSP